MPVLFLQSILIGIVLWGTVTPCLLGHAERRIRQVSPPTPTSADEPASHKRLHWEMWQFESSALQQWLNRPEITLPDDKKPHISQWESALYGKEYPQDSLAKRFDRLEKSLFHKTFHAHSPSQRFAQLNEKMMGHQQQFTEPLEQSPSFKYMEKRLTQDPQLQQQPVQERLNALETAVYGEKRTGLSHQERFNRLVYDIPITLSTTIQTDPNQQPSSVELIVPSPSLNTLLPEASHLSPVALPATYNPESTQQQSQSVNTPIRIFIQGETLQQYWWSHQALAFWNNQHQVFQVVPASHLAQLVLAWRQNTPTLLRQNATGTPIPQKHPAQKFSSFSDVVSCPSIDSTSTSSASSVSTACLRELLGDAVLHELY